MWAEGLKRENDEENEFPKGKLVKTTTEQCARECAYEKPIASSVTEKAEESCTLMWRKDMDDILSIILPPLDPRSPEKQILLDLTRSLENQSNQNDGSSCTFSASSSSPLTKEKARLRRFKAALSRQEDLLLIRLSADYFQGGVCQLLITQQTLNEVERLAKEYIANIQPHPRYVIKKEGLTAFLRPQTKLFDLVRKAVFNSPIAILHVKSIYAAILKRYPYFNTTDQKSFINWKSGLRHVLSLQWGFRVQFRNPCGPVKGYYYALLDSPIPPPPAVCVEFAPASEEEEDHDPMTREDPMLHLAALSASTSGSETPTSLCGSESPETKGWSPLEDMFDSPTVIRMVNHSPLISQGSCTSGFKSQESGYESLGSQLHFT